MSNSIVRWLQHAGAIAEKDVPIYVHSVYCFFFTLIPLTLVSVIGLVLGMFREGVLMIIPFYLLRKFSGGFHLKSPVVCFLSSTCLLTALLLCVDVIIRTEQYTLFSVCVVISAIGVFIFSPIDTAERALSDRERKVFKRVARFLVTFVTAGSVLLMLLGKHDTAVPVGMGLVITALLQFPCLFKNC